jgi:hypothetical protein
MFSELLFVLQTNFLMYHLGDVLLLLLNSSSLHYMCLYLCQVSFSLSLARRKIRKLKNITGNSGRSTELPSRQLCFHIPIRSFVL